MDATGNDQMNQLDGPYSSARQTYSVSYYEQARPSAGNESEEKAISRHTTRLTDAKRDIGYQRNKGCLIL